MASASGDGDDLRSRAEILDCIYRYARGVDRLDRDVLLSAYHPDAVDDHGVFVGSPEGFVEFFFDLHRKEHVSTHHIIANHLCEIDGDTAHAETYYIFASVNTRGAPTTLAGGRYIDRFERRDGRWAIAVRKCVRGWNMTPEAAVSEAIGAAFAQVGQVSRDLGDLSYDRPLTVAPERIASAQGDGQT
jgi:hypothetical protein